MKLIHYYHIYSDGLWQFIVHQHFTSLISYGLINSLDEVRVGIVGSDVTRRKVKECLEAFNIGKIVTDIELGTGFEQVTLNRLYEASKTEEAFYLYAHTKGCSDPSLINQLWCRSMLYYNVVMWRAAINELAKDGIDAVGCHWICKEEYPFMADQNNPNGYPFFGGTFWWAKSRHIRELGRPCTEHRWQAEHWIGKKTGTKVVDLNKGFPAIELFKVTF